MVEKACQDYSSLLQSVSLEKEINPICVSIDDMLTRLDEMESLLDNAKAETNVIMDQYVSSILSFASDFQKMKERIDQLENMVDVVNTTIDDVEKSIETAEMELNISDFSFKNLLLKPLIAKAKSVAESNAQTAAEEPLVATNLKDGQFQPVPIFKTSDFFDKELS